MRVLVIYSTANLGGAEIYAANFLKILANEVDYVVAVAANSFLGDEIRKLAIPILEIPITYPQYDVTLMIQAISIIMDYFKNDPPDIVQVHHLPAAMIGSFIANQFDIPLLFNLDSAYLKESYYQFLSLVPSFVLSGSQTCYNAVITQGVRSPNHTFVAVPGAELERFPMKNGDTPHHLRTQWGLDSRKVFGVAARLVEGKGIQQTLKAMQLLIDEGYADFQLLIAGDGPLENELQASIQNTSLADYVKFLNTLTHADMPSFYAVLDVFVLASSREGCPLSVLEAIASGVPVVATPVGDIPLLITHGVNGVLIKHTHQTDIADGIRAVLETPDFRSKCIEHDRQLRSQYDHINRARDVLFAYQQIAAWRD